MKSYSYGSEAARLAAVIHLVKHGVLPFEVTSEGVILADPPPDVDALIQSPEPAFVVVQEGGSSVEICLAVETSSDEAQKLRQSMAGAAYRSSEVVEVNCVMAALGEDFFSAAESVLKASLEFSYPEDEGEAGDDSDGTGQNAHRPVVGG